MAWEELCWWETRSVQEPGKVRAVRPSDSPAEQPRATDYEVLWAGREKWELPVPVPGTAEAWEFR